MSDDKKGKGGKNPWGNTPNKGRTPPRKPTNIHGSRHGEDIPDLDAMLRKAKNDFGGMIPGNLGGGMTGLIAAALLLFLFISLCTYIVKPGEHAVIQQFGAWERTKTDEGLSFKFPWPIESLSKVTVNEIRTMNIGFTEGFGRSSGQTRDIPEESLMLTSDRNIVDIDLVIQWNIKSAEDYVFNIKDQESTIKKVAESAIREQIGQTNMFPIITTERATVAQATKEIIQENLDEYNSGVHITQVLIQLAEVHPDVQKAFQDVQSAKQDAEDVQNRARAYREDIIPKARGAAIQLIQDAEGYKQSKVAQSTGDAERFNSVYKAYLNGKDVTKKRIYLETMEEVLGNAQKIIIGGGSGQQGVVPYLPLNELKAAPRSTSSKHVN
jgi:membrane protease subunit HflK